MNLLISGKVKKIEIGSTINLTLARSRRERRENHDLMNKIKIATPTTENRKQAYPYLRRVKLGTEKQQQTVQVEIVVAAVRLLDLYLEFQIRISNVNIPDTFPLI